MTREQLMQMSISQLRGLDIKTKEDELLVQDVLTEKLQDEPYVDPNRPVLPSEATDKLTPEKEKELQARIDGEVGEPPVGTGNPPDITVVSASEPVEVAPEEVSGTEEVVKPFCEYCDSKGGRHKKDCTRPNQENV